MEKRFLADVMLGRLARWLRILGYDTHYTPKSIDSVLIVRAFREGRIILTRNSKLYKKLESQRILWIRYDDFRDQVAQVVDSLKLKWDPHIFLSRCVECNIPLVALAKEEARTKVPPYVFQTVEAFRTCPRCAKIFWSGTHIDEMKGLINHFWKRKESKNEGGQ